MKEQSVSLAMRIPNGNPLRPIEKMSAYQRFCHDVVLPIADTALGQHSGERLTELLDFQWLARDEIERYRRERLQALLQFASTNVPFYREQFQRLGVRAEEIRTTGELSRLPVLNKQHLRERFSDLQVHGYRGAALEMKSSGSTGYSNDRPD